MPPTTTDPPFTMPWGMHRGRPPAEIDSGYLTWFLGACQVSPGVRAAISAELRSRGVDPPPVPEPQPVPPCRKHPTAPIRFTWTQDSLGRRHIKASCSSCQRFLRFAPQTEQYVTLADGRDAT